MKALLRAGDGAFERVRAILILSSVSIRWHLVRPKGTGLAPAASNARSYTPFAPRYGPVARESAAVGGDGVRFLHSIRSPRCRGVGARPNQWR